MSWGQTVKITNSEGEPTKEFFIFLKYNKILEKEPGELVEFDKIIFDDFVARFKNFVKNFEGNDEAAVMDFMALVTMFGFNRHYCSMTGKPIIGKYFKIGSKIVSKEAYESYKIIREMEGKRDLQEEQSRAKKTYIANPSGKKHQ